MWGGDERYGKLGTLHGLNLLFQVSPPRAVRISERLLKFGRQCIGSILSSQILRRISTRSVLVLSVLVFATVPSLLMILDRSTGGGIKSAHGKIERHGTWDTNALFPLYCISGVCYGMIELVKRVMPRDIVGGNVDKLRQIDSLVHICYESAGTGAAFLSSYLLLRLGSNYGMIMTPLCFLAASILWFKIGLLSFKRDPDLDQIKFWGGVRNGK